MKLDKQIFTLSGLNFSYYAANAILLPYLPLYLMQRGYTSAEIGLFMMIGPFAAIFAQPFWGFISDRYHTLKKIIFLLWGLAVLFSVGLFITTGFTYTLVFILLLYFFLLPSVPLLDSIAIKSTAERNISYGSVRMWGSVGFTIIALGSGPLLAGLGGVSHIPYLYWGIWVFPFILLMLLKDEKGSGQQVSLKMIGTILKNKGFLWYLFMVLLLAIPHRMNDGLLGLYLSDLGASDSMVSWAWALAAMSEIPTFALLSRYMNRYHELSLLGIAAALYTIRWVLYTFVTDPWVLIGLQATHSITFAVFWIVSVQYVVRLLPAAFGSTGQSLLAMVFMGIAGIVGGTIGGWISDVWGGQSMYIFGAVLSFIAAVLFFGTHNVMRKKVI